MTPSTPSAQPFDPGLAAAARRGRPGVVLDQRPPGRGRAPHRLGARAEAAHRGEPEPGRAVALVVLGGCTAAEVAGHEDIPLGTAKTRIRLGLMRLRVAMRAPAIQP